MELMIGGIYIHVVDNGASVNIGTTLNLIDFNRFRDNGKEKEEPSIPPPTISTLPNPEGEIQNTTPIFQQFLYPLPPA